MKPCSQVLAYGPNFHGRVLPLYALYGNVNNKLYYCSKLTPNSDKYYTIFIWDDYHFVWQKTSTQFHEDIRRFMASYMRLSSFVRQRCVPSKRYHKNTDLFLEKESPVFKLHPQPQYGKKSGCYSQSRVDGNGYDIKSEEKYKPLCNYSGIPVEYKGNKPVIGRHQGFNRFEGVGSDRRDGLKIDPTKCRPGKPQMINTMQKEK